MSPTGFLPSRASSNIYLRLRSYEERTRSGYAIGDNAAYVVDLPNRRSFSPDASFYVGPPTGGKFMTGAPIFAAEVRSEGDYGPAAEKKMAAKRADYFAAGTQVVWDVDVLRNGEVRVYSAEPSREPRAYRRGDTAEAEPALPGWTMPVDVLFEQDPFVAVSGALIDFPLFEERNDPAVPGPVAEARRARLRGRIRPGDRRRDARRARERLDERGPPRRRKFNPGG
jgi:Uma2 family endonuclease